MTLLKSQDKSEKATSKDDLCAGQNDVKVSQMCALSQFLQRLHQELKSLKEY